LNNPPNPIAPFLACGSEEQSSPRSPTSFSVIAEYVEPVSTIKFTTLLHLKNGTSNKTGIIGRLLMVKPVNLKVSPSQFNSEEHSQLF
jgi:hypothetical protein